jgi:hypothetical protein
VNGDNVTISRYDGFVYRVNVTMSWYNGPVNGSTSGYPGTKDW